MRYALSHSGGVPGFVTDDLFDVADQWAGIPINDKQRFLIGEMLIEAGKIVKKSIVGDVTRRSLALAGCSAQKDENADVDSALEWNCVNEGLSQIMETGDCYMHV